MNAGNKKKKLVRSCQHLDIEDALETYTRARILFMVGETLFKEDIISRAAF